MREIVRADRVHVLQRLRDLRDWARYIHESLSGDQPYEQGKRGLLEAYMGAEFLCGLAEDSATLGRRLETMIERIEASAAPAEKSCAG